MMARGKKHTLEFQSLQCTLLKDHDFCFLNENVEVRVKIKNYEAVNHKLRSVGSS